MREKALLVRKAKALKRKEEREAKKKLATQRREEKERREYENEKLIKEYKKKTAKKQDQKQEIKKKPEGFLNDMGKFFEMMDKYEEYKERKKIRTKTQNVPKKRYVNKNPNALNVGNEWDSFF